jgi:hypothetical protein
MFLTQVAAMNVLTKKLIYPTALVALLTLLGTSSTLAQVLDGTKRVQAVTRDGVKLPIGEVRFSKDKADVTHFRLSMNSEAFTDYFLSMKEFKCLQGPEVTCHVPYPYDNPQTVRNGDLVWLEHSLLFLFKQPRDFGAKLWNGTYYRFEPHGQGWIGRAQAIDLNHISAPSNTPHLPPYTADLRMDGSPGERWIDHLLIE